MLIYETYRFVGKETSSWFRQKVKETKFKVKQSKELAVYFTISHYKSILLVSSKINRFKDCFVWKDFPNICIRKLKITYPTAGKQPYFWDQRGGPPIQHNSLIRTRIENIGSVIFKHVFSDFHLLFRYYRIFPQPTALRAFSSVEVTIYPPGYLHPGKGKH